jgi:hypothetical protein
VLLNNYATNARIAQSRGMPWLERAEELAVLTVLQTEFPSVATDLLRAPRLLSFMRAGGEEAKAGSEIAGILAGYGLPLHEPAGGRTVVLDSDGEEVDEHEGPAALPSGTPAGDLLVDDGTDRRSVAEARHTLTRHLSAYLAKIQAGNIPDPKPDLFYLQRAGHVDGLQDPKLSDVIDFASDTPADQVVKAFTGQPSPVLATAVQLLATEAEAVHGPGRDLILEATCRLVEQMEDADIRAVARGVAPSVLASRNSERWDWQPVPGAIMLAVASNATEVARELIGRIPMLGEPGEVLRRCARMLTYAGAEDAALLHSTFGDLYRLHPDALRDALKELPSKEAEALWGAVGKDVCDTLADLEQPPSPAANPATGTARGGTARAAAAAPVGPTGQGRARLRELIDVARRADGERLLSAVLADAQKSTSTEVQAEVSEQAERVLNALSDEALIHRHALLGLRFGPVGQWPSWAPFLETSAPTAEQNAADSVAAAPVQRSSDSAGAAGDRLMAKQVLVERLLPRLAEAESTDELGELSRLIRALTGLADSDDDGSVMDALQQSFKAIEWSSPDTSGSDDAATRAPFRDRRRTAHQVAQELSGFVDTAALHELLAADIIRGVETRVLNEATLQEMGELIDTLDAAAAQLLGTRLDRYEAQDDEGVAVLRLRARTRLRFGGPAFTPTEMAPADDSGEFTSLLDLWLQLEPPVDDVIAVVPMTSIRSAALGPYAKGITMDARSRLWCALERTHASDGHLRSVGQHGVDSSVVDHMAAQVRSAARQADRDRLAERLMTASVRPGSGTSGSPGASGPWDMSAQRSANALAKELLEKGIAGDARLAARIVIWAGPAHGFNRSLRDLFDTAAQEKGDTLGRQLLRDLKAEGLLTPRKKGPLDWLFGGN